MPIDNVKGEIEKSWELSEVLKKRLRDWSRSLPPVMQAFVPDMPHYRPLLELDLTPSDPFLHLRTENRTDAPYRLRVFTMPGPETIFDVWKNTTRREFVGTALFPSGAYEALERFLWDVFLVHLHPGLHRPHAAFTPKANEEARIAKARADGRLMLGEIPPKSLSVFRPLRSKVDGIWKNLGYPTYEGLSLQELYDQNMIPGDAIYSWLRVFSPEAEAEFDRIASDEIFQPLV